MAITLDGTAGITNADGGTVLDTNDFADLTQAQNGTDNTTVMTPLRTSQAITAQVATVTAGLAAGAVGTYMYAYPNNTTSYTTGATIAGSLLLPGGSFTYDSTSGNASSQTLGSAQAGTWRLMGNRVYAGVGNATITLWLRIS